MQIENGHNIKTLKYFNEDEIQKLLSLNTCISLHAAERFMDSLPIIKSYSGSGEVTDVYFFIKKSLIESREVLTSKELEDMREKVHKKKATYFYNTDDGLLYTIVNNSFLSRILVSILPINQDFLARSYRFKD